MSRLGYLLPTARRRLLAIILKDPGRRWYVRELMRESGLLPRAVTVELGRLSSAGILLRSKSGRRVYYQANVHCLLVDPLRNLLIAGGELAERPVVVSSPPSSSAPRPAPRIPVRPVEPHMPDPPASFPMELD